MKGFLILGAASLAAGLALSATVVHGATQDYPQPPNPFPEFLEHPETVLGERYGVACYEVLGDTMPLNGKGGKPALECEDVQPPTAMNPPPARPCEPLPWCMREPSEIYLMLVDYNHHQWSSGWREGAIVDRGLATRGHHYASIWDWFWSDMPKWQGPKDWPEDGEEISPPATVPLPAAAGLLLASLGALVGLRAKRGLYTGEELERIDVARTRAIVTGQKDHGMSYKQAVKFGELIAKHEGQKILLSRP